MGALAQMNVWRVLCISPAHLLAMFAVVDLRSGRYKSPRRPRKCG